MSGEGGTCYILAISWVVVKLAVPELRVQVWEVFFYVERERKRLPVAHFSQQLTGAEVRYSATELEALAIVRSVN